MQQAPADVAHKAAQGAVDTVLSQGILGALVLICVLGLAAVIYWLIRTQELRIADQQKLTEKGETIFKESVTVNQEMRSAAAALLEATKESRTATAELGKEMREAWLKATSALTRLEQSVEHVERDLQLFQRDQERTSSLPHQATSRVDDLRPGAYRK